MKKRFVITLFSLSIVFCSAQEFKVYSVVGTAKANGTVIEKGMSLERTAVINTNEGSKIILLDIENKRLCTIQHPANDKIEKLILQGSFRDISDAYFQYVSNKLFSSDEEEQKKSMPRAATSFRDGDTILLKTIYEQGE